MWRKITGWAVRSKSCPRGLIAMAARIARFTAWSSVGFARRARRRSLECSWPRHEQQSSLGGDPHPVAVAAEVVAVGGDESDADPAAGDPVVARGSAGGLGGGDELEARREVAADGVARIEGLGAVVVADHPEGHLLDEADVEIPLDGERDQVGDLVVVTVLEHHAVQLDPAEPRVAGGLDPVQGLGDVAQAGDGPESAPRPGCPG